MSLAAAVVLLGAPLGLPRPLRVKFPASILLATIPSLSAPVRVGCFGLLMCVKLPLLGVA